MYVILGDIHLQDRLQVLGQGRTREQGLSEVAITALAVIALHLAVDAHCA